MDGSSWETAYTTINVAYTAISSDLDDKTIIFVGFGIFDVDIAGQFNIDKNIHIVGSGRDRTIIRNSHILADYVFNVTKYFKMEDCTIFYGRLCGGINVWGNSSDVYLDNILFNTDFVGSGISTSLQIDYGGYGEYKNIYFNGNKANFMAVNISNSVYNHFQDIEIWDYGTGVWINNNSNNNFFDNVCIFRTGLGFNINGSSGHYFTDIGFFNCTVNVDDDVGNSYW